MQSSFEEIGRHRSASFDVPVLVVADGPELAERVREAFGDTLRVFESPRSDAPPQHDTSMKRGVTLVEATPGTAEWDEWFLISGSLCQQQPVALVSQECSARAVAEAFRAGVTDVLVEPLDATQVRAGVERLLTRRPAVSHGAAAQRWAAAALAAVKPAGQKLHPAVLLGRAVEQLVQLTSSPGGSAFLRNEDGSLRLIPPFDARFESHQLRPEEIEVLQRSPQGEAVRFVPLAGAGGGHRWTLLSIPIRGFSERRAVLALRVGEATRRRIQFERAELAFFADEIGRAWEASQLQRMIHAAKQEYESIVDSTTDYLLLLDPDLRIRRVNRATQQALGQSFADILGRPFSELFPKVQPGKPGGPSVQSYLRRAVGGAPGEVFEVRNLLDEGDTHEIRAYPGPTEPEGEVIVLFVKDVGDLRRMEYRLRQSEKLASLGTLAAGVAHEINNPVGYVKSNLGRLKEYLGSIGLLLEHVHEAVGTDGGADGLEKLAAQIRKEWQDLDIDILLEDTADIFTECFEGLEHVEVIVQNLKQYATKGGPPGAQSSARSRRRGRASSRVEPVEVHDSGGQADGADASRARLLRGAHAGARQPAGQRGRRHGGLQGEGANPAGHDRDEGARGRGARCGFGQRGGDPPRHRRSHLRPLLHDEGPRQRHGARPVDQRRDLEPTQRSRGCGQPPR